MATKFNSCLIGNIASISVTGLAACRFHPCDSRPPDKLTLGLEHAGTLNALDCCSLRLDGEVAESCSLVGITLLSTFNSHSQLTLYHSTSLCFQTLGPTIFTSIMTMKGMSYLLFRKKIPEKKNFIPPSICRGFQVTTRYQMLGNSKQ